MGETTEQIKRQKAVKNRLEADQLHCEAIMERMSRGEKMSKVHLK
jgi:hypothetical protein